MNGEGESDQIVQRRANLEGLKAHGVDVYPHRFDAAATIGAVVAAHDAAGPGRGLVEVAGRARAEHRSEVGPVVEVARDRVAHAGVAVPQVLVAERLRGVQVVEVVLIAVVGEPEVPHPVGVEREGHECSICRKGEGTSP